MMYAVAVIGNRQYRVEKGTRLKVEKIEHDESDLVDFPVLMVSEGDNTRIGTPLLENAKVVAKVLGHGKGKKIKIIKMKRRKHHMKRQGHRQWFTEIQIEDIVSA